MKVSHSSKTRYKECGYSYYLHYMYRLRPIKEKSSLKFGSALDKALNHLLISKNLDESILLFTEEWKKVKETDVEFFKSDLDLSLVPNSEGLSEFEKNWASINEKARIMLTEYSIQVLPKIKRVIDVQHDSILDNGSGDQLPIKPDLICEWEDGKIVLFDNKTASRYYEDDAVKESEQLSTYYDALKEKHNITHCGFIVIPKTIRKRKLPRVEIQILIDTIDEKFITSTYKEYQDVLDGIKAAKFDKNLNSCIGKYGKCTYFNFCKNGNKDGLAEKE